MADWEVESYEPIASPYAKPAPAGGYQTALPPEEEVAFQSWVKQNNVPFDPSATSDYDMRGFYHGLQSGDAHAHTGQNANDGKLHFSDYWKTPYHKSFSNESQWATKDAPQWNDKDQLVTADGSVVYDERAQGADTGNPWAVDSVEPEHPTSRTQRVMQSVHDSLFGNDPDESGRGDYKTGALSSLGESLGEDFTRPSLSDTGTTIKTGLARTIAGTQLGDLEQKKAVMQAMARTPAQKRELYGSKPMADLEDQIAAVKATTGEISQDEAEVAARNPGFWQQAILNAAQSTAVSAPSMAVGIATRNPVLAAAAAYPVTAATTYSQLREDGVSHERALTAAAIDGSIESMTELPALGEFVGKPVGRMISKGSPAAKRIANFMVDEGLGESVAQVTQTMNEQLAHLPDNITTKDWMDAFIEGAKGIPQTLASVGLQSTVMGTATHFLNRTNDRAAQLATEREKQSAAAPPAALDSLATDLKAGPAPELQTPAPVDRQLSAPQPAPSAPDFVVDEEGRVRYPDQEVPPTPALPAPRGSDTFIAGPEGTQQLTEADARARQAQIDEEATLGKWPLRVPAGAVPAAAPAPVDRFEALDAARQSKAAPEQVAALSGLVTKSGNLNPAGRRELTSLKTQRATEAAKQAEGNAGIVVKPSADGFTLYIGKDPITTYTTRQNADEDAAAARASRLKAGQIDVLGKSVETPAQPTPGQQEAGNYKKPTVNWNGLTIKVETHAGGLREGVGADGKAFSRTMTHDYGYFKGAKDTGDGHVDVFLGKHPDSDMAYVIDQTKPDGKTFDEPKVLVGFRNQEDARAAYLANYPKGWKGLGAITPMPVDKLKQWVKKGRVTQPLTWKPPAEPFDARLTDRAAHLKGLAERGGWSMIGGQAITDGDPVNPKVVGRTKWESRDDVWAEAQRTHKLPHNSDGKASRIAIHKALAGEKLSAPEARHVKVMLDELDRQDAEAKRLATIDQDELHSMDDEDLSGNIERMWQELSLHHEVPDSGDEAIAMRDLDEPMFSRVREKQPDLFGDKVDQKNALKKLIDEKDRRRNRGQDSPETGKTDDLFSRAAKQIDVFTAPKAPPAVKRAIRHKVGVALRQVDTLAHGMPVVKTWQDAAHVLAPIRKNAQENMMALVLDAEGRPITAIRHSVGRVAEASVEIWSLLGSVVQVPGAKEVYFAHNHPSGDLTPSSADEFITRRLMDTLSGTGIKARGMLIVGEANDRVTWLGNNYDTAGDAIPPKARTRSLPVKERRFSHSGRGKGIRYTSASAVMDLARKEFPKAEQAGVLLFNSKNNHVGTLPMAKAEMTRLRTDKVDTGSAKVLRTLAEANASAVVLVGPNNVGAALVNLSALLHAADVRVLDIMDRAPDDSMRSRAEAGTNLDTRNSVFYSRTKPTDTPAFKHWFGDSKVVDAKGRPLIVYHGTTGDFTSFDASRANIESDFGAGFYFSNTPEDVAHNYAGMGPDLTNKIEQRAERIQKELADDPEHQDKTERELDKMAKEEAKKQLSVEHGGMTLPVYLSMKNPAIVGGKQETILDYSMEMDEETGDDTGEESGALVDFLMALQSMEGKFSDLKYSKLVNDIMEHAIDDGGIRLSALKDVFAKSEGVIYATDHDHGDSATHEILRQGLEAAGFDGIIDHTVDEKFGSQKRVGKPMAGMHAGTTHYIVFEPAQIKSAIGNSGAFDPRNPDIRFNRGETPITGLPEKQVRAQINQLLKGFAIRPKLTVVQSYDQLPRSVREVIEARGGQAGDMKALQYNGGLYFIGNEFHSPDEVHEALLHEAVTHFGLRSMLSPEAHRALLDGLAKEMPMEVRRRGFDEFGDRWNPKNDAMRRIATEEAMAYYGQKYLKGESIPDRMKRAVTRWLETIRQWLREKLGLPAKFDERYLKKLLQDLQAHLKSGRAMEMGGVAEPMMSSTAPVYYSALTRAVESSKTTKAPAEQWLNTLKNLPGIRQEEMDWVGLPDWLREQKGPITREAVSDFLRANQIQVNDVVRGGPKPEGERKSARQEMSEKASRLIVELTAQGFEASFDPHDGNRLEHIERRSDGRLFEFDGEGWVALDADGTDEDETIDPVPKDVSDKAIELGDIRDQIANLPPQGWESIDGDLNMDTKFERYTTPGGENYRELLLTLPEKGYTREAQEARAQELYSKSYEQASPSQKSTIDMELSGVPYRSSHWSEKNVLAHIRFDERIADGKRVLHIHEFQSDWHQAGRKRGYKMPDLPALKARVSALREQATLALRRNELLGFDNAAEALEAVRQHADWTQRWEVDTDADRATLNAYREAALEAGAQDRAVPNAPFKTTWPELAFKRALRWAAEHNFDRITWDTGQTNADRYDLRKHIRSVAATKTMQDMYHIKAMDHDRGLVTNDVYSAADLPDAVGKELADRIVSETDNSGKTIEYSGLDLTVGGEGMTGFYDDILPKTIGKFVKKWGGKVSRSTLPRQKMAISGGDIMRARGMPESSWSDLDQSERDELMAEHRRGQHPVHAVDVTPAMKQAVLEGLPLFSRTTKTPPADPDEAAAFNKQAAARRKLSIDAGGGAYNIALENLSQREIDTLQSVFEGLDSDIADQRRGKRPWSATEQAALDMLQNKFGLTLDSLVNRKAGSTANAERLEAYGSLLISATQQLAKVAERAANTGSNDDLLKLMMARERMGMLLAPAMGYRSEAGRALNILRKTAVQFREADKLWEAMGDGSHESMRDFARRVKDVGTVDQIIGLVRASYTPTWWDKFYEYWINGILSGPKTHAVNIASNALMTGLEFSAHAMAAVTGAVSIDEMKARAAAMVHGTTLGLANAYQAFRTETPQGDYSDKFESHGKAISGRLGKVVRIPGRLLTAEDEFFKSVSYHQELAGLAMREALKTKPGDPRAEFDCIMGDLLNRRDLVEKARAKARYDTFQTPMGEITASIARALDKSRVGRLIVPFLRTPTNILKSVAEYSPAAPLLGRVRDAYKEGGADWAIARSRILIGSGFMLTSVGLAAAGLMSGHGPDDQRERKILEATGWQPYSLKLGDRWVKYNRFDPLGTHLGLAADLYETSQYLTDDQFQKAGTMLMASITQNLGDKSYLKGLADFSQAYSDPSRYMQNYAKDLATSLIPNFVVQAASEFDSYSREARTLIDTAKSKVPGLRETLPQRSDLFGRPVKSSNFGWFIPLSVREQQSDPVARAFLELGINKQLPDRRIRGVELSSEDYQDFARTIGKAAYEAVLPEVSSPEFQQQMKEDPEAARHQLEGHWDGVSRGTRLQWLAAHPEIQQQTLQKHGQSKAIGSHYLDDLTSRVAPLMQGNKTDTVRALRDAGHPALASLIDDLPQRPRPIVAKALADMDA